MAAPHEIHGTGNDTSPVRAQALPRACHDKLDAGGDPVALPASSFAEPFSFLAVYRPRARSIRIYPIGVEPPFDVPVDLSEAQAHALCAELRRALDAPAVAEQLQNGAR